MVVAVLPAPLRGADSGADAVPSQGRSRQGSGGLVHVLTGGTQPGRSLDVEFDFQRRFVV